MQTPKSRRLSAATFSPSSTGSSQSLESSPSSTRGSPSKVNERKEREERRKSTLEVQRRKSFAAAPEESPVVSQEKVASMYSQIIKMSQENKINQKNTWNLHLIDYMKDVINEDGEQTNFQKASCTLDASVKIYGYRVDDTLYSSFRVLENLNRNETETEQVTKKVQEKDKSTKLHVTETIEKSISNLNIKDFGLMKVADPLFKHMSKLFDAGGTKGMLLNNLECYNGCMLIFDSNEDIKGLEKEDKKEDAIDIEIDSEDIKLYNNKIEENKIEICPELNELRDECGVVKKLRPSLINTQLTQVEYEVDDSTYINNTTTIDNNIDIDDDDDDDMTMMDNNEMNENNINKQNDNNKNNNYEQFESIIDKINEYGYVNTQIVSSLNEWKFKKSKSATATTAKSRLDKTKKKEKERKTNMIDYTTDFTKNTFNILKSTTNRKKNDSELYLLPETPYDANNLIKFFLIPNLKLKIKSLNNYTKNTDINLFDEYKYNNELDSNYIAPNEMMIDDDDDENDNNITSMMNLSQNIIHNEINIHDLVAPDHVVRSIDIKYAKQASNVDVRKLKSTIWKVIDERIKEENEEENKVEMSLSNTLKHINVHNLKEKPISPPKQNSSSVAFSFICLLHLANEKGLILENECDLSDVKIIEIH